MESIAKHNRRVLNKNETSPGNLINSTIYALGKIKVVTLPYNRNGKTGVNVINIIKNGKYRKIKYPT